MAYEGVVCGNCNGCNQQRSYDSIFIPSKTEDEFDGTCARVRTAVTEVERNHSQMMCSKSLFCRDTDAFGSGCEFHCERFGPTSETWLDPRCLEPPPPSLQRRLLAHGAPVEQGYAPSLNWGLVLPDFPAIKAPQFARSLH